MTIEVVNMIVDSKHIHKLTINENQIKAEIISLSKLKASGPKRRVNKHEIEILTIAIINASLTTVFVLFIILKICVVIFMIFLSFQI